MENLSIVIGKWLKQQRKDQNITILELSRRAGISHASISRVENQHSAATALFLRKIFNAMEIPFENLIDLGLIPSNTPDPENYFKKITDYRFSTLYLADLARFSQLSIENRARVIQNFNQFYFTYNQNPPQELGVDFSINEIIRQPSIFSSPRDYIFEIRLETLRSAAARDGLLIPNDLGAFL